MREAPYSFSMKVHPCLLIGAFCWWVFPLGAASVPAVSNSGQSTINPVLVGNNNLDLQVAVSFTTGPLATELASVMLHGSGFGGTSSFRVALYTGMGSTGPTGIVATLAGSASPGALAGYTYNAPATLVLSPNVTYWLVASAPSTVSPSGFSWQTTLSVHEDPGALSGWSIGDGYWRTNNGGASWLREDNPIPQFSVQVNTRPEAAPVITIQPTPLTPFVGANVTLSAAATGNPVPNFQWRRDGAVIPGATTNSLTLMAGATSNAGTYSVVASNSIGSVTSLETLVARPAFITSPASQRVVPGATVNFTASPSSNLPVTSYQWLKDGFAIPASTAATLTVPNVQVSSVGSYSVVATNIAGSTTSSPATLSLLLSEAGRLTNLSIRTNVGIGGQALIVGFVTGGANTTGTKPLLMRGAGPALGEFGLSGFLADPTLSLFSGTTVLASNDNWAGDAQVTTIGSQVGAFAFAASSRDAALYSPTLGSGTYTIQIAGVGGTSGIALAEIYDPTPANLFFANTPRLINVSARAQVGTATNIPIVGFTISGNLPQTVLIRAIGPTLGGFGITGALADPKLELYAGNSLFLANDNWGDVVGAGGLSAAAASVGAFPLDPASRDAVQLVTLKPGSYSAQVSGVGNTTGVALIEIYEVP